MRRNQYQDAVLREFGAVHTRAFVAGHRLAGMRRHLEEVAAEPPLLGNLFNGERVTPTLAGGTLLILLGLAVHQREALLPMRRRSRRN